MPAKKKFKKAKTNETVHSKKEEKVFEVSYNIPFKRFNSQIFPTAKVLLPTLVLFLGSMLFLVLGNDGISKIDQVLVSSSTQGAVSTGQVAGIAKQPEIKIVGKNIPAPNFSSNAVLAQDFDSGTILYQKNVYLRLAPASTTKLMTALVAVDHYKAADVLIVPQEALVGGSTMGLRAGDRLSFRSLLYGMLLDSGNDAAYTIALNYPGGMNSFIAQMNLKVSQMGLTNTHFVNPAGFDDNNHYSSAYDLSKIAKQAALNYELARIVATKDTQVSTWDQSVSTTSAEVRHEYNLHNLNQLLSEPGVLGMKTGTTEKAGENLVGLVERSGHKVITVMLGSKDRFNETSSLMKWVYSNYSWE